jgi:hypothetical protein
VTTLDVGSVSIKAIDGRNGLRFRCRSGSDVGMERETLHAPVEQLGHIQLVLRRARDLVDPTELLRLLPRLAEHAEDFSVE